MKLVFFYVFVLVLCLGTGRNAWATNNATYTLEEDNLQQQTGSSSFANGYSPFSYDQFALNAQIDTNGADLSAAPILGLPGATSAYPTGSITFPTGPGFSPTNPTGNGYDKYKFAAGWTSADLLNTAFGSGTFTFTLGDATAMPTLSLDTVSPAFPVVPTVTSGGTWNGGVLIVNPTASVTLDFNSSSFTSYSSGSGGQIDCHLYDSSGNPILAPTKSQYIPALGKSDTALSSFTIPSGTLTAGQTYAFQVNYEQVESLNLTSFTGTGISGSPRGATAYAANTFVTVVADPFSGSSQGNGLYSSPWFGFYTYPAYPLAYEYNLGYEYIFPAGSGVYLYDYTSGHFWYTQSNYFPFIYDFSLNAFLYYYQANTPHRHFYDFGTNAVISE